MTARHPITRLPKDIFLDVLQHNVADIIPDDLPIGNSVHPTLAASHVSKLWRQIVLECPTLWTRLIIHSLRRDPSSYATLWLTRSGTLPIVVFVTMVKPILKGREGTRNVPTPATTLVGRGLRDTLFPHFGRFSTFSLVAQSPDDIMFFLDSPIKSARLLQNLTVFTPALAMEQAIFIHSANQTQFPPTPLLRTIRITNCVSSRAFFPQLFRGLEVLDLGGQDLTWIEGDGLALDVGTALAGCPDLREFTIQGSYGTPPGYTSWSPQSRSRAITFPKLTMIYIGATCVNVGWLDMITAPNLEEFTLADAYYASDEEDYDSRWASAWRHVQSFVQRSSPPLWKFGIFEVGGGKAANVPYWECLRGLKELKEIWIKHANLHPVSIFDRLRQLPQAGGGHFCPKLEKVVLISYEDEDYDSLIGLCLARPTIVAVR